MLNHHKQIEFIFTNISFNKTNWNSDVVVDPSWIMDNKLGFKIQLPDVIGNFINTHNQLKTLEGSPKHVGKDFNCSWNELDNLKGSPESVGGTFNCIGCGLRSLEGSPKYVGRDFDCTVNKLINLIGSPDYVKRNFYCYDNFLKSLEGSPKYVGGDFDCSENSLRNHQKPIGIKGKFKV